MTSINSTLLSVLLTLGSVLIVVIIYLIFRIARTVTALQAEVRSLNSAMLPLLERVSALAESTHETLEIVSEHRDTIGATVENFRKLSRNILRLEEILQRQVEPSLVGLASVLGGIRKGIQTFSESWRRSH